MRLFSLVLAGTIAASMATAGPVGFVVNTLATNASDGDLVNAWGLVATAGSPWWIGANQTGKALVYNAAGVKQGLVVAIPGDGSVTGVTTNPNSAAGSFNGDLFLFDSEDGTISGWRGALGTTAETLQVASDANVYKGLTYGSTGGFDYLYAANFRAGTIDVLRGTGAPALSGNFTDPNLPAGFAPFNVQAIGGTLYVTYAKQDATKHDDVPGLGNGFVDTFTLNGQFIRELAADGALNSPWGLTIAPSGFGELGGDLLVGNFGDGLIHAYNTSTGALVQTLQDRSGNPIAIDGLWALQFGNGAANNGPTGTLFFTAGPDDESGGRFGNLVPAPEPGTWLAAAAGLLICAARARYRR